MNRSRLSFIVKVLSFLAVCFLVGCLPLFIHFGYMKGWYNFHLPRGFHEAYDLANYYECVNGQEDSFEPPLYQPVMVNTALLILYSSVTYSIVAAVLRRITGKLTRRRDPQKNISKGTK